MAMNKIDEMNVEYLYTMLDYLSDLIQNFDLTDDEKDTITNIYIRVADIVIEIERVCEMENK